MPVSLAMSKVIYDKKKWTRHNVLGIGYRQVKEIDYRDKYIKVNYVSNDKSITAYIADDQVYHFYFIYK